MHKESGLFLDQMISGSFRRRKIRTVSNIWVSSSLIYELREPLMLYEGLSKSTLRIKDTKFERCIDTQYLVLFTNVKLQIPQSGTEYTNTFLSL